MKLTTRHRVAVDALLHAQTVRMAAELCGVPERTLYGWRKDPDFAAALTERRRELTDGAFNALRRRMTAAADEVYRIMQDAETPAGTRLQAARMLLEFGCKAVELQDVSQRLDALEEAYAAIDDGDTCR